MPPVQFYDLIVEILEDPDSGLPQWRKDNNFGKADSDKMWANSSPEEQAEEKAARGAWPQHERNLDEINERYQQEHDRYESGRAQQDAARAGARVWPSRIVLYALVALVVSQELAGLSLPLGLSASKAVPGNPYQGQCFGEGSQDFAAVAATLQQAVAQEWTGGSATAYNQQNQILINQANAMVDLDRQMQDAVSEHAECVTKTQEGFAGPQAFLILVYPVVASMEADPITFFDAYYLATAAAALATGTAVGLLSYCLGTSIQTMQHVQDIDYSAVSNAANQVASDTQQSGSGSGSGSGNITTPDTLTSPSGQGYGWSAEFPAPAGARTAAAMAGASDGGSAIRRVSGTQTAAGAPDALTAFTAADQLTGSTPEQTTTIPDLSAPGAVSASMASAADGAPSAPAGRASTIPRSTRASTPPQQNLSQPVTSAADSPDTQTSSAAAETPGAERAPLETVAPDHSVTPTPTPTP